VITVPQPATAADVARHYDELDRFYRELWGEHVHHGIFESRHDDPQEAALRLVRLVAERAFLQPGQHVCDVGCGYGATARELAAGSGVRVTGITLSATQARRAVEAVPEGAPLRFIQGDWLANGFDDASFDAVIAIECLAHMTDKERFFVEAARTLRPGGRLVVCAWLAAEGAGLLRRRLLLEPICREGALPGMNSEGECRELMERTGFAVTGSEDLSRKAKRTWTVSATRLVGALLRNAEYRRALRDRGLLNRRFALSVFRIRAAYELRAMRLVLLTGRKR